MCLELCFSKFPYLKEFHIYIDCNNVVYNRIKRNRKPVLNDLILMLNYLINVQGFKKENIDCICDPGLRFHIDKPVEFEALIKDGVIKEAPKIADEFILSFALKHEFCFIISNDKFREYIDQLPSKQWIIERRVSFMFIGEEVCLSPNVDYDKIDVLPLNDKINKEIKEFETKITTLEVLKNIEKTEGEFDLY